MPRAGMKRTVRRRAAVLAACVLGACAIMWGGVSYANPGEGAALARVLEQIDQQEARLNAQHSLLQRQQHELEQQRALIAQQRQQILAMSGAVSDSELGEMRGAGAHYPGLISYNELGAREAGAPVRRAPLRRMDGELPAGAGAAPARPAGPVGEAPPEQQPAVVDALPEGQTALLGRGRLVIEPSIEYSRSSSNRLVYRGVEIVTGVQIGLLEANNAARDTLSGAVALRYALTDRLEIEGRVPYVYRSDRITTVSQANATLTQTMELEGADLGDVELSARYQLNRPTPGGAIFVAGGRVKSDTGRGPFDLARDQAGVASELATGSGFWGVQGSLSVLYPSDPAVLFANLGYQHNIGRDIDRTIGTVTVGEVNPGDSISAGFGFGFALNPRFSYSLGYSHSYVMETETELNATRQRSSELQVGALQLGMSFRASERLTLATSISVGVTEDAPDVSISFRTPFRW